jgi:hypothetical protein
MKPYLTSFKYNIEVREVPNTGKTWMVYEDFLNKGLENPKYTDHVELHKDCPMHTSERSYEGLGFGMVVEGKISYELNEITGKRFIYIIPVEEE